MNSVEGLIVTILLFHKQLEGVWGGHWVWEMGIHFQCFLLWF